jgi:hypothetical protein
MLNSYLQVLKQALALPAGQTELPPSSASYAHVGIGIGILALVQTATLGFAIAQSPGTATNVILILILVSAVASVTPLVVFAGLAAVSMRLDRLPLTLVAASFYVALIDVAFFALSLFITSGRSAALGILGYFSYRTARNVLGMGVGASIGAALLVVLCVMSSGLLLLVIPGGEALIPS